MFEAKREIERSSKQACSRRIGISPSRWCTSESSGKGLAERLWGTKGWISGYDAYRRKQVAALPLVPTPTVQRSPEEAGRGDGDREFVLQLLLRLMERCY